MQNYLQESMPERTYLLMVGVIAFFITVSMTIPFASILIGAVLLRHASDIRLQNWLLTP